MDRSFGRVSHRSSCGHTEVLPQHTRVPGGHSQKRERGTLGRPPALLPISQRVNADSECFRECTLGQSDETTQRGYVVTTDDVTSEDAFALLPRDSAREIPRGQFWNVVSQRLGPSTLHTFASPFLLPHEHL